MDGGSGGRCGGARTRQGRGWTTGTEPAARRCWPAAGIGPSRSSTPAGGGAGSVEGKGTRGAARRSRLAAAWIHPLRQLESPLPQRPLPKSGKLDFVLNFLDRASMMLLNLQRRRILGSSPTV